MQAEFNEQEAMNAVPFKEISLNYVQDSNQNVVTSQSERFVSQRKTDLQNDQIEFGRLTNSSADEPLSASIGVNSKSEDLRQTSSATWYQPSLSVEKTES